MAEWWRRIEDLKIYNRGGIILISIDIDNYYYNNIYIDPIQRVMNDVSYSRN